MCVCVCLVLRDVAAGLTMTEERLHRYKYARRENKCVHIVVVRACGCFLRDAISAAVPRSRLFG